MELKYLIPIAGVVLGWVLSQLSGAFSLARENRRYRAAALPAMIDLYFQQYRINKILEFFNLRLGDELEELHKYRENGNLSKDNHHEIIAQLFASFELRRQRNIDLPDKQKDALFKSLAAATESLSKVAPALAYRLSRLSSEFVLFQEIRFPETRLEPKNYLETHGNLLGIFRDDLKELRNLIVRTAFGLGVIQFIELILLLRAEERKLQTIPKEVIETLLQSTKPCSSLQKDEPTSGASLS